MTLFALFAGLFLALLFKATTGPLTMLHGLRPELVACLVAYAGMTCKLPVIIIFCFIAGVMQDSLSHNLPGISAFAYTTIGIMIHSQRHMLYQKGLIPIMLTGAVTTFWSCTVTYLLMSMLQRGGFFWSIKVSETILILSIVNLFATPVVFFMINLMTKIRLPKQKKKRVM